ncbi:hypothetical protein FY534_13995 (plasmid) [Alicyclobacillus sp. TC]|uniref:Type II secretion system protein GspF domain-containing protein n=1 Tax=Alicyclobacillus tolerans TaxID=90970 RepID=A0ABT9LYP6_9BACL|nr:MULTISPECIES: hypothetical protein [Alicyclobacillus]MDP9729392.1 hypothetical protein [Alicyclobacillus tengchongensis]QRF24885.1 hypothetical protein FY534_13995 [Alicyclobacillus sp. TC]
MMGAWWVLALGVIPAVFFFVSGVQTESERIRFRARVMGRLYAARAKMRSRSEESELQTLFYAADIPWKVSTYRMLRWMIVAFLLVWAGFQVWHRQLWGVLPPLFFVVLTDPHKGFPMHSLLLLLQKQATKKRNRSVYLLYRLLYQAVLVFQDRPVSVYDLLRRQWPRVPRLAPFLQRCLLTYVENPKASLERFAEEVGTKQAKTLTDMLWQMEEGGAKVALDVFQANYESFQADRKADFKAKISARSLLATGLVMMGLLALDRDINVLVQIYTSHILQSAMK